MVRALSAGARLALAGIFNIVVRVTCFVDVHGLEHDPRAGHTYYAISHKRDMDPIILLPPLLRHRGWRALAGGVRFAMRADAFTPGFLARVLGPTWLGRAVRPLAVGCVVRFLGALPIDSLQRPVEEWLRDTLRFDGDGPANAVLSPGELERLAAAAGERTSHIADKPMSTLFAWRYLAELRAMRGPEVLAEGPRRHSAKRYFAGIVRAQLGALSSALRTGGALLGAPEGGLSPDGRVRPVMGGLARILRDAPADTRVIPVVVVYDFMRTGRPRVFVDLAPPLSSTTAPLDAHLPAILRGAWLHAMRFTCTQLATGYLVWATETNRGEFTLAEMALALRRAALFLATTGRHVDAALLDQRTARRAAAAYLAYARRHGLAHHTKTGRWLTIPRELEARPNPVTPPYDSQPLAYAWNELLDMLGAEPWVGTFSQPEPHEAERDWLQWMYKRSAPVALPAR